MAPPASNLFLGGKFWLSQNVPQRKRFKEMIMQHGGSVVLLMQDADVKLVDHKKKNLPADCYSYQYVEDSVRNGRLEDLEAHRAGPSAPRPMGASHIPTKSTRLVFSLQDDQLLFDWLQPFEKESNAPINGNRIYQDLAIKSPRHTWQSWRSRYLKRLRGKPRPGGGIPVPFHELNRPPASANEPLRKSARVSTDAAPENHSTEEQRVQPSSRSDMKRKRDMASESVVSPSKRRAVEETAQNANLVSRNSRHEGNMPPSDLARPPADNSRPPKQGTANVAALSASSNAIATMAKDPAQEPAELTEWRVFDKPTNGPVDPTSALMLELPFVPSSPEPDEGDDDSGQDESPDVDAWIDARLRKGDVDERNVIDALRCTSMDAELAEEVLGYLAAGKGIPDNMPGVWTAEDDRHLEGETGREIERVLQKHGSEALNARWKYLSMARAIGLI